MRRLLAMSVSRVCGDGFTGVRRTATVFPACAGMDRLADNH